MERLDLGIIDKQIAYFTIIVDRLSEYFGQLWYWIFRLQQSRTEQSDKEFQININKYYLPLQRDEICLSKKPGQNNLLTRLVTQNFG